MHFTHERLIGRKWFHVSMLIGMICTNVLIMSSTVSGQPVQAASAEEFLESIGINTHFGGAYNYAYGHPGMPEMVHEIGFRHVRDNNTTISGSEILSNLYNDYGIQTNVVIDTNSETQLDSYPSMMSNPWASTIEGLNEPDGWYKTFHGMQDLASHDQVYLATRRHQAELYDLIKGDSGSASKPVLLPAMGYSKYVTTLGQIPFDFLSFHRYPQGDYPDALSFTGVEIPLLDTLPNSSGKPVFLTETGYHTALSHVSEHHPVPESIQAKYLPRLLAKAFKEGVSRTYLYELADEGYDQKEKEDYFGLVAFQPSYANPLVLKPAGQAIKRLLHHLDDSVSPDFTPQMFDFTLDAGSANLSKLKYLVLQENDGQGTFNILIWQEVRSYNTGSKEIIYNPPISDLYMRFNTLTKSVQVYNLNSDTPILTRADSNRVFHVHFDVQDEIYLVKVTPSSSYYVPGDAYVDIFADDSQATENSSDVATIRLVRHFNLGSTLRAYLAFQGKAVNGTDFQALNTYVDFPIGVDTVTFNITPTNDSLVESDEQVVVIHQASPGIYRGFHNSATVTIKDDECFADVIVSDISWDKTYPQPGDPITFYVTIKNQGTIPTNNVGNFKFHPDFQGGTWTIRPIPAGIPAGGTYLTTISYNWPAHGGQTVFEAWLSGFNETNTSNNYLSKLFVTPYATLYDDFENGISTTHWNGWTVTGNWQGITYSSGGTTAKTMTYKGSYSWGTDRVEAVLPVTFATSFAMEFDYDWEWGGGATYGDQGLFLGLQLLDDSNNGYLIRIAQGAGINGSYADHASQLIVVNNGAYDANNPLLYGTGYNQAGFKPYGALPRLKKVRVEYDQVAKRISIYGDTNQDDQLELFLQTNTELTYDHFTKIRFLPFSTNTCAPLVDNVRVMLLNPLDDMHDDFTDNMVDTTPVNWTPTGNWKVFLRDGNMVLEDYKIWDSNPVSRQLVANHHASWEIAFDFDWAWGGVAGGVSYGFSNRLGYVDLLDENDSGYRLKIRQGNSNNTAYDNQIMRLYRMDLGVETFLGQSAGYNMPGWKTRSLTGPDLKRVKLMHDPSSQQLTVCADLDHNGVMEVLLQVVDPYTAFTQLDRLQFMGIGYGGSQDRFTVDNVRINQLHTSTD